MRSLIGPRSASDAQRGAHASRVDERGGGAGRLLLRATTNTARALAVENRRGLEPAHHRLEIAQRVEATESLLTVDEIQP